MGYSTDIIPTGAIVMNIVLGLVVPVMLYKIYTRRTQAEKERKNKARQFYLLRTNISKA